jgi:EAL and modified HD-GYP domain-containing signal transduction protein
MELMDLASREAPASQMERALRRDATLSFRLLRYINSAGFGLSCEIQSLGHAVAILGYRNLSRWLALLLAGTGGTVAAPALVREAAIRGRLAELLGEAFLDPGERDSLFITGVFSMLPYILKAPMSAMLAQLTLPGHVTDALTDRSGLHGPLLSLAESVEAPDTADPDGAATALGLSATLVNRLHVQAITWAEKLAA